MKNDTLLRLLPEGLGDALCETGTHLYSVKFKTMMPVHNKLEIKKDFIVNITHIDIFRTKYETYIVKCWNAKQNKETYNQYATLKEAWTFKRGKMRIKGNTYNEITEMWNYDNYSATV